MSDVRRIIAIVGVVAALVAVTAGPSSARAAASQAWSPFVLVAGLLLVGLVANVDGVFVATARAIERLPGGRSVLLVVLLALVAVVTAVLNLDTSVAFLTPVLVLSARRRGLAEAPFLYGALLMSNAASLLLPGSNLTNLIVLAREHVSGALFAARMFPAWVAAIVTTTLVLLLWQRALSDQPRTFEASVDDAWEARLGLVAIGGAAALVVLLQRPALPVLAVGVTVVLQRIMTRRLAWHQVSEALDAAVLIGLFGVAVALGTLARSWDGPAHLLASAGAWQTAAIGATGAVLLNNLPAAVLFTAQRVPHPRSLLLGLNLGPNLAVSGSLSALLWYQAARRVGAKPSVATVSRVGAVLVPLSIAAAGLALSVFAPQHS